MRIFPLLLTSATSLLLMGCAAGYGATQPAAQTAPATSAAAPAAAKAAQRPTNVILFIADGASWEAWNMAGYWARGTADGAPWDGWPVKLGMTTFPLNTSTVPTMNADAMVSYDPAQAWTSDPVAPDTREYRSALPGGPSRVYPAPFSGYRYLKSNYTDSAAAGTVMATGTKSYNSSISMDNFAVALDMVSAKAKRIGKASGVVTSVPVSHATPAVFGANNLKRDSYHEIARDMIGTGRLDVIIGTGNPDYDDNGVARADPAYQFIGPVEWAALKAGTSPFSLVQSTRDIKALADGARTAPDRLIAMPMVGSTLQFARRPDVRAADPANPSGVAFNPDLPDLAMLTRAGLNRLGRDGKGFFLMVEGGAVDWAAHANETGRIIEEQLDFERAVQATVDWLRGRGMLDNTLIIVTTDHGNGLPLGPDSDRIAWQPVVNNGKGKLAGVRWHSHTHTNEVVRLWARGPGADCLTRYRTGVDAGLRDRIRHNADGAFIDNSALEPVMTAILAGAPCPK